ncbi:thiol reductant ABC exporter subunit CydD [Marinobacterium sp. LSUCC0821]|uniref:thiol reductant ABC exporter subunit CydD n=1 Tax=Marinobacterium sp. LSUCC0821 TaxID=2668067 RepID=UPI0014517700|nr:thiol reductant ABC exporter subunit CydD [Marinobacterium sp. LSUCC0821]QJD71697.1 thiol reductant ABC exporter subunit CydD [Marinobacterium sp. LSUCC0821]
MARKRKSNPTDILDQHNAGLEGATRLSLLLGLVQTLSTLGFAYSVSLLIGMALANEPLPMSTMAVVALITGLLAIKAFAQTWQNTLNLSLSVTIRDRLRQSALSHCFTTGIALYPRFKASELANLLASEIDKLKDYFAEFKVQKQMAVWTPVLILLAASTVNWLVPLILLLTTPLIPVFMILLGNRAAEASRANLKDMNRLGHLLEDRLRNLDLLQQQNAIERETAALYSQSENFRKSTMRVLRLAFLSGTLLEFFAAISVALVAVYLGLLFLDKYDVGGWSLDFTFADGAFLLMLAPEYYLPLRKLGALYHAKSNAKAVAEVLNELADSASLSTSNIPSIVPKNITSLEVESLVSGTDSAIHRPISFTVMTGQTLLIDAPSGSGKTTLLDSLAGLRTFHSGTVRINGEPLNPFHNPKWFSRVGYISQHPELIYGSIKENLMLGRSFSEAELWDALRRAQLEDVVAALPNQLDYFITDAGDLLSGGQIQRLAIARVFLHQPALLLLDEPVANLDQETAEAFLVGLKFHTEQGGILIMASHRVSERFQFDQRVALIKETANG